MRVLCGVVALLFTLLATAAGVIEWIIWGYAVGEMGDMGDQLAIACSLIRVLAFGGALGVVAIGVMLSPKPVQAVRPEWQGVVDDK